MQYFDADMLCEDVSVNEEDCEICDELPSKSKIYLQHWKMEHLSGDRSFRITKRKVSLTTIVCMEALEGNHTVCWGTGSSDLSECHAIVNAFMSLYNTLSHYNLQYTSKDIGPWSRFHNI